MTRHRGFSTRTAFLLAAVLAVACAMARAQTDYPVKPIRLVVPFPPGGSVDLNARLLAIKFSEVLGQQIVVDNRAGASGQIGSEMVGRSAPDGYTLLLQSNPFVTSTILYAKPLYDPVNDFVPISLLSTVATAGRCPSLGAGPIGAGADRIRARAPGAAQLRVLGDRQQLAHDRGALQSARQDEHHGDPVQRRRACARRGGERRSAHLLLERLGDRAHGRSEAAAGARSERRRNHRRSCPAFRRLRRPACPVSSSMHGTACSRRRARHRSSSLS